MGAPSGDTKRNVVVAAAIVRGDMVLLGHRRADRKAYPNVWDVVGGHVEPGETRIQALVREVREELGVEIDPAKAVSVLQHTVDVDLTLEIWAVDTWTGTITNAAPEEHDEIRWFPISEIDALDLADAGVAVACRLAVEHFA